MSNSHDQRPHPRPGVEADNYLATSRQVHNVVMFGVIMVVTLAVILLGMWVLFGSFQRQHDLADQPANPFRDARRLPPEPRVRPDEIAVLRQVREKEAGVLGSYGWVNAKAGVVHIPIEQAMELWLQRQGVAGATTRPREATP